MAQAKDEQDIKTYKRRLEAFLLCPSIYNHHLPDGTPAFHTSDPFSLESFHPVGNAYSNRRFGHMVEDFFAEWVKCHAHYRLLAKNLQIVVDGHTLGELDFLLEDGRTGHILHIELACKFYIWRWWKGAWQWVGPNLRDSLREKLAKLQERQFPLLHQPAVQAVLGDMGLLNREMMQVACFKGQLFLPVGSVLADPVNPCSVAGRWVSYVEFAAMDHSKSFFRLPAKHDWLLGADDAGDEVDNREALERLASCDRASMVWRQTPGMAAEQWFVLPG